MATDETAAAWTEYQEALRKVQEVFVERVFVCHECGRSLQDSPGHSEYTTRGGTRVYHCVWCSGRPKTKSQPA